MKTVDIIDSIHDVARVFDDELGYGWWDRIDLETLNMKDSKNCVAAQLEWPGSTLERTPSGEIAFCMDGSFYHADRIEHQWYVYLKTRRRKVKITKLVKKFKSKIGL